MTKRQQHFQSALAYFRDGPDGDEHEIGGMAINGVSGFNMLCIKPANDTEEFYYAKRQGYCGLAGKP